VQEAFAHVFQNALMNVPGVVAIETEEAQAIRAELLLSNSQANMGRVVPVLVKGEFRIKRSPGETKFAFEISLAGSGTNLKAIGSGNLLFPPRYIGGYNSGKSVI